MRADLPLFRVYARATWMNGIWTGWVVCAPPPRDPIEVWMAKRGLVPCSIHVMHLLNERIRRGRP